MNHKNPLDTFWRKPKMPKKSMKKAVKTAKKSKASAKKVTSPIASEQASEAVKRLRSDGSPVELLDLKAFKDTEITPNMEAFLELGHTIGAAKPKPQSYIRVKDDPEWKNIIVPIIEYQPTQEYWIVVPKIAKSAGKNSEITKYQLHLAVTEFGRWFVWPTNLGKGSWHESRKIAAKKAVNHWVRVKGVFEKEQYITIEAEDDIDAPQWPDLTAREIITIAFGNRVIRDHNHPLLRKLQGKSGR